MAIEILTEPQDPVVSGDWTNLLKISQAGEVPELSLLTGWESVGAVPAAKQGAFIRHAANTYQIKDSNYTILGSTAAGINYIVASASGGVMTLTWSQDITGFSYDATNKGIYNASGDQVLRDVLYIDGTDYIRGYASGMDFEIVQLADGSLYSPSLTIRGDISFGSASASGEIVSESYVNAGGTIFSTSRTQGSTTTASTIPIPAGIYDFYNVGEAANFLLIQILINGTWRTFHQFNSSNMYFSIISDGVNYRFNPQSSSRTIYWIKHS